MKHFGVQSGQRLQLFAGKPKSFAESISGLTLRSNKGCPYLYPNAAWALLRKHDSYDIERVAQDLATGKDTKDFLCSYCGKMKIVEVDGYCKTCYLSWRGIGARGMGGKFPSKKKGVKGNKGS